MLTELRIRNFAIIESLSLPLAERFNVLTGETGAGKSIIIDALSLLLGERAASDQVRSGADRATVEGVFDIDDRPELLQLLDSRGIDVGESVLVLRREISAGGRTRAWINGSTTTTAVLAEVGRQLVNLHGQHEAQTLLDSESQRQLLDEFGGTAQLAREVTGAFEELSSVTRDIRTLETRRTEAERRADYLRHVVDEIEEAALVTGEDAQLEEEARRLEHADELRALASGIASALDGDEGATLQRLASIQRSLSSLQRIDPALERLQGVFDNGYYALEELFRELSAYARDVDLDPARLDEVQHRRDLVFRLTKKYGPTIAGVLETHRRSREELDLLDSAGLDLRELERRRTTAVAALSERASRLTAQRMAAATSLAREVDEVLPSLGMPDGRLSVDLMPLGMVTASGAEKIEFRILLNLGHDARPLARVASGGELSRVMLAIKTILAAHDRVPTLVFDEVDSGIGGRVALQVGETLRRVAAHHQVLVITHLPQIAARANHHIVVTKNARHGVTAADTTVTQGADRVREIARMLSGDAKSDTSLAHAAELLRSDAPASPPTRKLARKK